MKEVKAVPSNIQWGYFDRDREPRIRVESGEVVQLEVLTGNGAAFPEGMMDRGVRLVYERVQDRGPGPHILTGPIYVEGAEPGDALEVRVLDLQPRTPYGVTARSPMGLLHHLFPGTPNGILWKVDMSAGLATGMFRFLYPEPLPPPGQSFTAERIPCLARVTVPTRPHLGVAGVCPDVAGRVSSIAPGRFGGNLDQWRFGPGTAMTYPVLVRGALFVCGDGHLAQGDGEVSSYGIESHLNATIQLTLHKQRTVGNPILETPDSWVIHGFGATLDEACHEAATEALEFFTTRGINREEAYLLMSVAVDFGVTQVVDKPRLGAHAEIRKALLANWRV